MKALGLIILCVVLLATLQASYLIVEAKRPRKPHIHVEDHTHDENDVSSSGHVTDDVKLPRHNKHHHHKNRDGESNDEQVKEQLVHTFGSRITGAEWKDRKHPNQVSGDLLPPANSLDDKTAFDKDELDPNGILAEDIPIPKVDPPTTENNVTERIDPAATIVKEPDTLPLYDQMIGDQPDHEKTSKNKKKSLHRAMERKDRKQNKHHKKDKGSRHTCETDADCEEGGCCLQRKKGERVCKKGGVKDIGKKCSSSCVCKTGLQCYVSTVNKHGKKRHPHPGKMEMGRCADPDTDQKPGYFMSNPPANTDSPPANTVL